MKEHLVAVVEKIRISRRVKATKDLNTGRYICEHVQVLIYVYFESTSETINYF